MLYIISLEYYILKYKLTLVFSQMEYIDGNEKIEKPYLGEAREGK